MKKYDDMGEPTMVTRDAGYSKIKSISSENRIKIKERINNPDIRTGKYRLKKLFAKRGIVVIPEKMTIWYHFID